MFYVMWAVKSFISLNFFSWRIAHNVNNGFFSTCDWLLFLFTIITLRSHLRKLRWSYVELTTKLWRFYDQLMIFRKSGPWIKSLHIMIQRWHQHQAAGGSARRLWFHCSIQRSNARPWRSARCRSNTSRWRTSAGLCDAGLSGNHLLLWSVPISRPPAPAKSVVRRSWHQLSIDELKEALAESLLCQRGHLANFNADQLAELYDNEIISVLGRLRPKFHLARFDTT